MVIKDDLVPRLFLVVYLKGPSLSTRVWGIEATCAEGEIGEEFIVLIFL